MSNKLQQIFTFITYRHHQNLWKLYQKYELQRYLIATKYTTCTCTYKLYTCTCINVSVYMYMLWVVVMDLFIDTKG